MIQTKTEIQSELEKKVNLTILLEVKSFELLVVVDVNLSESPM